METEYTSTQDMESKMSKKKTAQNGKGSKYRPVDKKEYDKNIDNIVWTPKDSAALERIYGKKEGKR